MNDNELTKLLKENQKNGFEAVIRQYSAYVMKIARTRLDDVCASEDIEEAVSDVFLKFYYAVKERSFDIPSVKGLLAVIAQRHCTDVFRRQIRREDMLDYNELENMISDAECSDDEEELVEALKQLGKTDCNIFMRKYYFGQKNKDIAKELVMPIGTLNSRISRGLEKLRKILEEGKL